MTENHLKPREIKSGQIIVYQGEVPRYAYKVNSGLVRAYNILNGGDERTIALISEGETFPLAWLYDAAPVALYFYEALTDCTITPYTDTQIKELMLSKPEQALKDMANAYTTSLMRIDALGQSSAKQKISKTLLFLGIKFGISTQAGFVKINIKLTQQDIANLANTSRETAAVELMELKDKDIIMVKDKFYTVNVKKLAALSGEEQFQELL